MSIFLLRSLPLTLSRSKGLYISNFLLHSPPHFPQFLILYFHQDPIDCMSNFLRRRPSHPTSFNHFLTRSKGLPIKMSSYWRGGSVRKCDSFVKGRVSNYVWRHICQHCIHFTYLGLVHSFSLFHNFYFISTFLLSNLNRFPFDSCKLYWKKM